MVTNTQALNNRAFQANVDTIIQAGGTVTSRYQQLAQSLSEYLDSSDTYSPVDALTTAVIDGAPASEIHALEQSALIRDAATRIDKATIRNHVEAEVTAAMRVEYRKTAATNYDIAAGQYDQHAARYSELAKTVDPAADAATLVTSDKTTRDAWAELQTLPVLLEEALGVLHTAARLAGAPLGDTPGDHIALAVQPGDTPRRDIWDAWNHEQRWPQLSRLTCELKAPDLDDARTYREPKPIVTRYERTRTGHAPYQYDTELGQRVNA